MEIVKVIVTAVVAIVLLQKLKKKYHCIPQHIKKITWLIFIVLVSISIRSLSIVLGIDSFTVFLPTWADILNIIIGILLIIYHIEQEDNGKNKRPCKENK